MLLLLVRKYIQVADRFDWKSEEREKGEKGQGSVYAVTLEQKKREKGIKLNQIENGSQSADRT